jgi:hypothetical protein
VELGSEPACVIPASGDWEVSADCWLHEDGVAAANVVVLEGVTATINGGTRLDIDLSNHSLRIKPGGKVLIKPGGTIE